MKKKTVKELNEDVIILEKRVKELENVGDIFDKLSSINLVDIEKKIKMIQNTNIDADIDSIEQKLEENNKCLKNLMEKETLTDQTKEGGLFFKRCQENFHDKKDLSKHIIANHPKEIKCEVCEESFDKRYKIELYLKIHELETFKCNICAKLFHMKWRLEKHVKVHDLENIKFCHYFNNEEKCL